jgi:hypothetical protein
VAECRGASSVVLAHDHDGRKHQTTVRFTLPAAEGTMV